MNPRIQILDNLRGLAIILMLLQHIPLFLVKNLTTPVYSIAILLSRFSAPLFFLLAGYCTYLSFNKNGPVRLVKRSIEIFIYGLITNIFRNQPLLSINVLTSISAFILICTIILFIRSKYTYLILLFGLIIYSFMSPEIASTIIHLTDIVNTGEYPIAPWLIYSIIGLGIAWIDKFKTPKLVVPLSILSILFGLSTLFFGYYNIDFMNNTPPFMFIMLGFIGCIYTFATIAKINFLGGFGKNSLFIYTTHLFIFSWIPVILNIGKPLEIYSSLLIYLITLSITYLLVKEE